MDNHADVVDQLLMIKLLENCKFPNKSGGRGGEALGGTLIRMTTFPPSSGFLQSDSENRTMFD